SDEEIISTFAQVMACDQVLFKRFFHAMLEDGVYLAPSAFEAGFVSAAHSSEIVETTLNKAERAFAKL
ncbi:MAG: aspartate aminotransferase family protein, partial [Methylococcaceae bacterium]